MKISNPSTVNDNSITTAKLVDGSVTTAKLADLGVTGAKIADLTIGTAKIGDATIGTAKIFDGSITSAKLGLIHILTTLAASVVLVASTNTTIFTVAGVNGKRYMAMCMMTIQAAVGADIVDAWFEQSGVKIFGTRVSFDANGVYRNVFMQTPITSDGTNITVKCLCVNANVVFGGASLGNSEGSRLDLLDLG